VLITYLLELSMCFLYLPNQPVQLLVDRNSPILQEDLVEGRVGSLKLPKGYLDTPLLFGEGGKLALNDLQVLL
jgi:hypothetical protein